MKVIAFYLPQFHQIPENDEWWGEGFTEWTNTKKARPLYKNHYQPKIPLNQNYYNLLDNNVFDWQIKLAKKHGIDAFCFYHYWFKDGKKLLEKPVESFLSNTDLNMSFCLSWANEPWSRRWDGSEHQILMPQEYGDKKEWEDHFNYLLSFFKDKRYMLKNNKPIFVIYKPDLIPNLIDMLYLWNEMAIKNGFSGIAYISQHASFFYNQCYSDIWDYNLMFEPGYTLLHDSFGDNSKKYLKRIINDPLLFTNKFVKSISNRYYKNKEVKKYKFGRYNYDIIWKNILNRKIDSRKIIQGAFVDWDNSARTGKNSVIFHGSSPEKFQKYLSLLIKKLKKEDKDFLFITAWNEWAEGSYLEPDEKHEYKYLESVKNALIENGEGLKS